MRKKENFVYHERRIHNKFVNVNLPYESSVGDKMTIIATLHGKFRITQVLGQRISFGELKTTTGVKGFMESTAGGDAVCLVCTKKNKYWQVVPGPGGSIGTMLLA